MVLRIFNTPNFCASQGSLKGRLLALFSDLDEAKAYADAYADDPENKDRHLYGAMVEEWADDRWTIVHDRSPRSCAACDYMHARYGDEDAHQKNWDDWVSTHNDIWEPGADTWTSNDWQPIWLRAATNGGRPDLCKVDPQRSKNDEAVARNRASVAELAKRLP